MIEGLLQKLFIRFFITSQKVTS